MNTKLLNIQSLGPNDREAALRPVQRYLTQINQKMLDTALRVPFYMNQDTLQRLQAMFTDRLVILDEREKTNYYENTHPISAFLTWYAHGRMTNSAEKYVGNGLKTMEIGGKFPLNRSISHNCLLIESSRDAARHVTQHIGSPISPESQMLYNRTQCDGGLICSAGAQNCLYAADIAYAINSLYEVTFDDLISIFVNHNLKVLDSWMFLPLALIDGIFSKADDDHYCYREFDRTEEVEFDFDYTDEEVDYDDNGEQHAHKPDINMYIPGKRTDKPNSKIKHKVNCIRYAQFSLKDCSNVYTHKLSEWRKWVTHTKVETPEFDIVFEVVRSYGSFRNVTFTKTIHRSDIISRVYHFGSLLGRYVRIPNLYVHMQYRFTKKRCEVSDIVFPLDEYMDLIGFCDRQSEGQFHWTHYRALVDSKRKVIKLGDMEFFGNIKLDAVVYQHAVFSIFILGAILRTHRTQGVVSAFEEIKRRTNPSIWQKLIFQKCRDSLNQFKNYFDTGKQDPFIPTELDQSLAFFDKMDAESVKNIMLMQPISFKDYEVGAIYKSTRKTRTTLPSIRFPTVQATHITTPQNTGKTVGAPIRQSSVDDTDTLSYFSEPPEPQEEVLAELNNKISLEPLVTLDEAPPAPLNTRDNTRVPKDDYNSGKLIAGQKTVPNGMFVKFPAGHCLLEAFYNAADIKMPINEYLDGIRKYFIIHYPLHTQGVDDYLNNGNWDQLAVDFVPLTLATIHKRYINVVSEVGRFQYGDSGNKPVTLRISNAHWTPNRGGYDRDAKYGLLLDRSRNSVVEISCAPGFLGTIATNRRFQYYGYNYTKGDCKMMDVKFKYEDYADMMAIDMRKHKPDTTVMIDIGCDYTEGTYINVTRFIEKNIQYGFNFVWKIFDEPEVFKRWKYDVEIFRNMHSNDFSAERYALIQLGTGKRINNYSIRSYTITVDRKEVESFITEYHDMSLSKDVVNSLREWKAYPMVTRFVADTGIAGCGKSSKYIDKMARALFIVPTQQLMADYIEKGVPKQHVSTYHTALAKVTKFDRIVIDEVFTLPLAYIAAVAILRKHTKETPISIYVLGDKLQIPFIDFRHNHLGSRPLTQLVDNHCMVSKRCPQDIIDIINNKYKQQCTTTSDVKVSLYRSDHIDRNIPLMVFNQATKRDNQQQANDVLTVHEAQGRTYKTIQLYVDQKAIETAMLAAENHVFTAITRHTDKLIIIGRTEDFKKCVDIKDTVLELYTELANNTPYQDTYVRDIDIKSTMPSETVEVEKFGVDIIMVEQLYDKWLPRHTVRDEIAGYTQMSFSPLESGTLRVKEEHLVVPDFSRAGVKISAIRVAKGQTSYNHVEAYQSLIQRYMLLNPKSRQREAMCNKMFEGLNRILFGSDDPRYFKKLLINNQHRVGIHTAAYLESLKEKLKTKTQDHLQSVAELESFTEFEDARIKYFNKSQYKWIPDQNFDFKMNSDGQIKCGQGIAAWPKYLNVVYSAYFRYIMETAMDNKKPTVFIAAMMTDEELCKQMQMANGYDQTAQYMENDYSGWDSRVTDFMIDFDAKMLKWAGCPYHLVEFYRKFREHFQYFYEGAKLQGHFKQQSGSPSTFTGNTLGNIGITSLYLNWDEIYSIWKGDDSLIRGYNFDWKADAKQRLRATGHQLKMHISPVGEFAGFVTTPSGFAPDLVRRVAKFISKVYADEKHFNEAKMSVDQDLSVIRNEEHKQQMFISLALHYKELGITPMDVCILHSFADKVKTLEFKNYKYVKQPLIKLQQ